MQLPMHTLIQKEVRNPEKVAGAKGLAVKRDVVVDDTPHHLCAYIFVCMHACMHVRVQSMSMGIVALVWRGQIQNTIIRLTKVKTS
jgi:hypothetical protein